MTWNYRIVQYPDGCFGVHEVYYDDAGHPVHWTAEPIAFVVRHSGNRAAQALNDARLHPVLALVDGKLVEIGQPAPPAAAQHGAHEQER